MIMTIRRGNHENNPYFIHVILSTLMAALSSANALAADANITFNGTLSANTCTLAAADASKVLTIPNVAAATLYAAGGTAYTTYNVSSSFGFSACPAGLTKVTSNYTYQGSLAGSAAGTAVATGTATNVGLFVMQSSTGSTSTVVSVNGVSSSINQATIASNAVTVPITVGIAGVNPSNVNALPTVGTYTGTYLVAFTYS